MSLSKTSINNAKKLIKEGFFSLDTETTGGGKYSEIVEIAIIDSYGNVVFQSLIKPYKKIPLNVIAIHGITNEMVADAPRFSDIAMDLYKILNEQNVVAHNANFDRARLMYEFARCEMYEVLIDWYCSMRMATPEGGKWPKLAEAVNYFNIDIEGTAHRAEFDAECCRRIIYALAKSNP